MNCYFCNAVMAKYGDDIFQYPTCTNHHLLVKHVFIYDKLAQVNVKFLNKNNRITAIWYAMIENFSFVIEYPNENGSFERYQTLYVPAIPNVKLEDIEDYYTRYTNLKAFW